MTDITLNHLVSKTMTMLGEGNKDPSAMVSFDTGDRFDRLEVIATASTYRGKPAVKHTFKLNGERISHRAAELLFRAYPIYGGE